MEGNGDPPRWAITIRTSRWYRLPWHYLVLTAWAARWFQVDATHGGRSTSWHLFTEAGRLLFGMHPAGFGAPGGLRLFASYPRFQFGPGTLVVAAVMRLLGPGQGLAVAQVLMAGCGLVILFVAERTAGIVRPDLDPEQIRWTVLGAGSVFVPVWSILAVGFMHLDDVLALLLAVLAIRALAGGRPALTGALLAASAGAKPWAFGFMALLLALPSRDARLRGLGWAAGVTIVGWAPFVIADPGSVAAARYAIPNALDSGLRALGVNSPGTPPWDRAAQILLGFGLSAVAVWRGRWPAVVLICTAVRIGLDPNDYPYYDAGPVVGALIWDLMGARRAVPAWTLAAGSLFWGWTAVLGEHGLAGDLRVGFAVAAALYTIIAPAGIPQLQEKQPVMIDSSLAGYLGGHARGDVAGRDRRRAARLGRALRARPAAHARRGRRPRQIQRCRHMGRHPAVRVRGVRHRGAGRCRGGDPEADRVHRAEPGGRRGRPVVCQPGDAAGDQALVRPRPPVLVLQRVPVRGLPDLRAGLDVRQPPRPGQHHRRGAAVGAGDLRRAAVLRVPVGDLRRARHRALAAPDHAVHSAGRAGCRAAVRQPARARAQRAAGHGDRDAALAAAARLSALRSHPDRRQHR